jgi:Ubiquitin-activating enzyme E1 FCCH domain
VTEQIIQASFNAGEWSPKLYARVDMAKYRSGAAKLENFFVDYRGGASTRPGTKYVIQCRDSAHGVRLLPFQASFSVGYVLEFGEQYLRFMFNGAPVLEATTNISGAANSSPCVITSVGHGYTSGDWVFITGVNGMTQLNNNYYLITVVNANSYTLADLNGVPINAAVFGTYTSGGTAARVYTIVTPYHSTDLQMLKVAQNVNQMVICHPSYQPYVLTLIAATNWTLQPITIGSTASAPTGLALQGSNFPSPGSAGQNTYYAYVVTTIDGNGQESSPTSPLNLGPAFDMRAVGGTISISWNASAGAVGYNVYKADVSFFAVIPAGVTFGYIGTTTGTSFPDTNINPDFTQTPPISKNPFLGNGVASVAVTAAGTYTTVPTASLTGAASTIAGSLSVTLQVQGTPTIGAGGAGYAVNDRVTFTNGVVLVVNTVSAGAVLTWKAANTSGGSVGAVTTGSTPANPVVQVSTTGAGTGATANLVWGVGLVTVTSPGSGYTSTPNVTFSSGAATATATLGAAANGFPSVPGYFQQRLVFAAPSASPSTFYCSQPGAYFNFNVSQVTQADDSIIGTLVSGQLNTIKAIVPQTSGLLIFTDRTSWLVNGGSPGSAISPQALVANPQSFNGISDIQPIIANYDVLYVQAKGSIVRDSAYNIYANVYTGTDISAISSHLFFGYTITGWAWAEEPFKLVWAVRSDGVLLNLTFLKEQEFVGWAHSVTQGSFLSVTTVIETTATAGNVDAVYVVVQRTVNGNIVKYIERFVERTFAAGVSDAWCVDCGLQYSGAPATSFSGANFLAGMTVTGLADGVVIPAFVMPVTGAFTLATPASKVTIGLGYTCDAQTLPLDIGEPTIQGKPKKIVDVTVRVADTLGLTIGSDFTHLVPMKDLVVGNVSSMLTGQSNQVIAGLVTGDARTNLDPTYTIPGQYCIRQSQPLPATILGVIPEFDLGQPGSKSR